MKPFKEFAWDYKKSLEIALAHIDLGPVEEAVKLISSCRGTVWLIGNGGSAALASHMATDLQLAGVKAISLTDVSAITTYANDMRYVDVFSEILKRLATKDDLLIAISGSGNSYNVIHGAIVARDLKIPVVAITGFDGGKLGDIFNSKWQGLQMGGVHINVPSKQMGVAQDGHQVALHMICYYLMERRKVQ